MTWPAYSGCPSGWALQGYTFTLDNASLADGDGNVPARASSLDVELGDPGTAKISYVARCAGGLTSSSSPALQITVN